MRRRNFFRYLALIALVVTSAVAADGSGPKVIPVDNGVNTITLLGEPAMAVRAWRENYNAHGFDVVSFYVRDKAAGEKAFWNVVPVFGQVLKGDTAERLEITVGGGADCVLHDFRLLRSGDDKHVMLVIAQRDMGESFADAAPVHFTWYDLVRNEEEAPGDPWLSFRQTRVTQAMKPYCDVEDALDKELHLGTTSGNGGPGDTEDDPPKAP
jgi:hypothetical protein